MPLKDKNMKPLSTKLSSTKKLSQRRPLYKPIISINTALVSALLITGCQSTNIGQSGSIASNQTPTIAKTVLADALQKQRRQSFSYHSNLEINNDQQVETIKSGQLVSSDYVDSHCDDSHDQAYASLIAKAEAQGKDISEDDYDVQRAALKQSYLNCDQAYRTWDNNQYESDISDASDVYTDSTNDDYTDDTIVDYSESNSTTESLIVQENTTVKSPASNNAPNVPASSKQIFDDYDDKSTALDIKKAQLLDAYLLKPLSMNAQGVYQPLAGRFTMLASAQYQARNNQTNINQPIYVDFKTGSIYLWADNFALINSELLDDKLGTKWKNKWLKIAIDDGTLPKGFGSTLIKSHFEALDSTYNAAPISQFNFVSSNTLSMLSPKLPQHQLIPMLQSSQIISRNRSTESYQQFYRDYITTFYNLITTQYPELIDTQDNDSNEDDTPSDTDKFTSKVLVQRALVSAKKIIDGDSELLAEVDSSSAVQELYGIDNRGHIKWQHLRTPLSSSKESRTGVSDGVFVDVLQQYSSVGGQDLAFPNLPAESQVPNASNSIDMREYGKELAEYYREGNGAMLGKMMFSMMPIMKNKLRLDD